MQKADCCSRDQTKVKLTISVRQRLNPVVYLLALTVLSQPSVHLREPIFHMVYQFHQILEI
jgi:hypothetical protein